MMVVIGLMVMMRVFILMTYFVMKVVMMMWVTRNWVTVTYKMNLDTVRPLLQKDVR
jgi:hypothetical protein